MSIIESIKEQTARKSEVEAALVNARERVSSFWGKARPIKDWLNGHDWSAAQLEERGVAREHAERKQELESLEAELGDVQHQVTELEGELLRLLSAKFSAKDILEFRHKEYQVVQSELQESEAWGGTLRDQLDEARRGLRETEADLVKAHAEQSRALSMDALDKTQQAVIEAGRLKATVSALISNLEVALKRASAGFEVLRTKVGTAEKALWSAKAEASAETVKASPEFEVLKNSLMEGFAASVEACEEHNLVRYLAGVFGAKGVDGNQVVNELGVIRVALKGELGVNAIPGSL